MSINKAMNISLTGLNANQKALNVVSHNIANMNTEGYARQRVNFAEMRVAGNGNTISGQIASLSGVKIAGITTASNDYMNNYFRTQNSIYEGLVADADTAGQLADLLDELQGTGLGNSLSDFFSAANSLNQNPTDYSLRVNYAEKANAVAKKFNSMYSSVEGLQKSKVGNGTLDSAKSSQAGTYVDELNTALDQLSTVNKQLLTNKGDASLETQRDQLLSKISSLSNVTTSINSMGIASVKLGNVDLVAGSEVINKLDITANGNITATDKDNKVVDVTNFITGGSLGGTLSSANTIKEALDSLNQLANAFADTINSIQTYDDGVNKAACYNRADNLLELSNENLFASNDGQPITASNIAINSKIYKNPDLIAAARVNVNEQPDWEKSVGNGNNALELYNAQNERIPALNHLTINDFMISLGTKYGLQAAQKQQEADVQGAVVDGINNKILSETGVNLDEELSNMIMYQQAYNASARVFSTCVSIYDTLIALGT